MTTSPPLTPEQEALMQLEVSSDPSEAKALRELQVAEAKFLLLFGWVWTGEDEWLPPPTLLWEEKRGKLHKRGHAVNSQKLAIQTLVST